MIVEGERTRERWEIRMSPGSSREFIYTNKGAAHFSGESNGPNSRSYHGLFCAMRRYLDSWELFVDEKLIDPSAITHTLAYPHTIHRIYGKDGVTEEIVLPDTDDAGGQRGLAVRFNGLAGGWHGLVPWVDMRFIWEVPEPAYIIYWEERNNTLLISRADFQVPMGMPRWLAITASEFMEYRRVERFRDACYPKDAARRTMARTKPFMPGRFAFRVKEGNVEPVQFVFGLGRREGEAVEAARELLENAFGRFKREKLERVEELVERVEISTGDTERDRALRWAMVSLDNLVMNQRGRGIYTGLHWFPNYWGRDSFICLPGACLATRRFETAREIILSFMAYQQTDPRSAHLGRFPNIVNPDDLQYAGVDGTWWLVRAAWKHIVASADTIVLREGFPPVHLAIEGALGTAVDELGFLTHGNGETWMDAGGDQNPYSPRGNRAVEVQALFYHGLLVGAAWARTLARCDAGGRRIAVQGPEGASRSLETSELLARAAHWEGRAAVLRDSFRARFLDESRDYLFDHLNSDGTPDRQVRPNALLALWVSLDAGDLASRRINGLEIVSSEIEALVPPEWIDRIVETAAGTIILPHGVTSLDPNDPQFHPHHLDLDRYYYDEAYHNGDVWEWLSGPAVSCLLAAERYEEARRLLEPLVDEILHRACVGSLREIRDGADTKGKEEFGGATSQAWSLAEFIRVCLTEIEW